MQSDRQSGSPTSPGKEGNSGERIAANSRSQSPELPTPSARSQSTQALLQQVATAANGARQRFTERITQGTEAIAASIQQQQSALIAAGEQQTGAIQALFANARAQVGEIVTSAQAQLQTDATSHLATLQQGHAATQEQVATTFSSGQERAQTLGNTYAERSLQTADESTQQVQTRIEGMAQESRAIGQQKAQVGGSTPEIAQAKARAANEIASDTATKITSGVSDAMRDLRGTGPDTARGFREQGQEAARQVGAGQAQVVNQLNTSNQQTASGIQQAVTQGSQALGNLGTQLTAQLASLEQTIQNQLQTQIAQKSQEIATAGQQAITTFQQQGQQAIASGNEHLTQFNQQLAGMDIDPSLAAEVTGEIVGQVNGAYDNLIATTDGAFQQADGALTQAGTEVINAINAISTNASGQIQTFLGQAQGQVTQQVGTISGQLGTTVTQANAAGSGMVSQVTTSLDGQIGQIDSSFGQGLEQYRGGLNEQVTSATEQAQEPRQSVSGRIDEAQRKAEERAKSNWFVNQWNDLVEMVSSRGFWAGLITGLILGAIVVGLVIAGVLTGGVAIVAAAAIVGAIAAGVGTIVGNHAEGRPWDEGLVSNVIFGAFGGAVGAAALLFLGGVAAGAGLSAGATLALLTAGASVIAGIVTIIDNFAHNRPWDKGLLANMALAGILTFIGGKIEGRFRGRASGGSKQDTPEHQEPPVRPPAEKPPVRPPGEEPPVRPPGEEPPGNKLPKTEQPDEVIPTVEAKKTELFNRAKQLNKRADDLAKKFGKENDPEIGKIQEDGDEILVKVDKAESDQLDNFERTLDENTKKINEIENQLIAEVNTKVQTLKDLARRLKNRAYEVIDEARQHENHELNQIVQESELIESELKQGRPEPKTLEQYEYDLSKNNQRLREIEIELGIRSPFEYIEEVEPGVFKLKPEAQANWRSTFYECRYNTQTYAEITDLRTTPRSKGGWRHETDPNLIWDEVDKVYVNATEDRHSITVDHNPESVVDHWNSEGHNMGQEGRHNFFRDKNNHKYVLKKHNSSDGGKKSGSFIPKVGEFFSGPGDKR
jgi:hypothetical protein